MPKTRKVEKKNGKAFKTVLPMKLRIGPRKGGKSAFSMTTEELEAVLADSKKKKYHNKARTALSKRS